MTDVSGLPDITGAPTYADALELSGGAELSYRSRTLADFLPRQALSPRGCMLAVMGGFLFGPVLLFTVFLFTSPFLFFNIRGGPPEYVFSLIISAMLTFALLVLTVRYVLFCMSSVKIGNGRLSLRRRPFSFKSVPLEEVVWVGLDLKKDYVFTGRGRVLALPESSNVAQKCLLHLLYTLARLKNREEANMLHESGGKVTLPLSEGATRRRLAVLGPGVLLLLSCAIWCAWKGVFVTTFGGRSEIVGNFFLAAAMCFLPAFLAVAMLYVAIRRFFDAYGLGQDAFSPEGFESRAKGLVPYVKMKIVLYRGKGNLEDPEPGLLEITMPEAKKYFIGQERQNFFVLPYVLEKWAGGSFEVKPMTTAPYAADKRQYRDTNRMFLKMKQPRRLGLEKEKQPLREKDDLGQ